MKIPLSTKPERDLEAGAGIEPANSGFADRDLTTWLPRRLARADNIVVAALVSSAERRYIGVRRGERLCKMTSHSADLFARATKRIPGGVNSPVRAFRNVGGVPFFVARG